MTEDQFRTRELIIKAVTPIITVAGILVGIWQFTSGERRTTAREYALIAKQDSIEFKRKTWEEQLATYRRLVTVAGEVATSSGDQARFSRAVREFDVLYWGLMTFVQDKPVESAMLDFHIEISDFQKGRSSAERLKVRANMLIQATRESLARTWTEVEKAS